MVTKEPRTTSKDIKDELQGQGTACSLTNVSSVELVNGLLQQTDRTSDKSHRKWSPKFLHNKSVLKRGQSYF